MIDYFKAWDYSRNANPPGDFGIWEEGKEGTKGSLIPVIHSSSIAAILSGFIHINGLTLEAEDGSTKIVSIPEEIIHNGFEFLNERISLVGECEERPYDLTSLIILYDHLILKEMGKGDLLTKDNETKILNEFALLERDYGFMRYASEKNPDDLDDYHKPQKKSAEWTMGFGYAALIYEKLGQLKKALKYVEKMEKTFDWETGLGLPEAYFGGTNRPVPISPLSWSNALYLVTYETIRKHTENELAIQ